MLRGSFFALHLHRYRCKYKISAFVSFFSFSSFVSPRATALPPLLPPSSPISHLSFPFHHSDAKWPFHSSSFMSVLMQILSDTNIDAKCRYPHHYLPLLHLPHLSLLVSILPSSSPLLSSLILLLPFIALYLCWHRYKCQATLYIYVDADVDV